MDKVLPRTYGVQEHPLFCFMRSSDKERKLEIPSTDRYGWYEDEQEDPDVILERENVIAGANGTIIINDLKKVYSSTNSLDCIGKESPLKFALKGIHLRIQDGECFGLLGPNGAGKTTL